MPRTLPLTVRNEMPRRATRLACVLTACLILSTLGFECDVFEPPTVDIEVLLFNDDPGWRDIHILAPGERLGNSNALAFEGSRTVTVAYDPKGSGVEFRAGWDGEVRASVVCVSSDPRGKSGSRTNATVTWAATQPIGIVGLRCAWWSNW